MLTKNDFDQIKKIVSEEVRKRTKRLPTTNEFYKMADKILGELKAIREEHAIQTYHVTDHEKRLNKLEKIAPTP